jgi:hypothetical protein
MKRLRLVSLPALLSLVALADAVIRGWRWP